MRVIRNFDVSSLYPSLMIFCKYISRNIDNPQNFIDTYETRLAAKNNGDKATAGKLKLPLNTCFGAMLNQYNDLYDPLMGRSVCVSGQLFLTELVLTYLAQTKTIKIINFNTDGVMFSIEDYEMPIIYAINDEWEKRTKFTLEEDKIRKVIQKDVNNYIIVGLDGKIKVKGSYLVHGISNGSGFNINNNLIIVKEAVKDYFVEGKPVEETILAETKPLRFQIIAKTSSKYSGAFHIVNDERVPVQRVNRVYATPDTRYGTIVRVHAIRGNDNKIGGLPDHCIIDNTNTVTIDDIDKEWYIDLAKRYISDFIGGD